MESPQSFKEIVFRLTEFIKFDNYHHVEDDHLNNRQIVIFEYKKNKFRLIYSFIRKEIEIEHLKNSNSGFCVLTNIEKYDLEKQLEQIGNFIMTESILGSDKVLTKNEIVGRLLLAGNINENEAITLLGKTEFLKTKCSCSMKECKCMKEMESVSAIS